MQDLSFLTEHCSIPAKNLLDPAPNQQELAQILQAAMSAPDHGHLQPFRFLVIEREARYQLSEIFESATRQRDPHADAATIEKQKQKPLRSPMIIVVIACIQPIPKIPEVEQILCAGSAAQHIQLACGALGYGSIWLTGENCYDLTVHQSLGLDLNERIIGFIYVGTPDNSSEKKIRQSAEGITQNWKKPQVSDFAI